MQAKARGERQSPRSKHRFSFWLFGAFTGEVLSACLMFWYPAFYGTSFEAAHIWYNILPLMVICTVFLIRRKLRTFIGKRALLLLAAALAIFGIVLLGLIHLRILSETYLTVSMLAIGFSSPLMLMVWWELFVSIGPRLACFGFAGSLILGRIFAGALVSLSNSAPLFGLAIIAISPALSLLMLFKSEPFIPQNPVSTQRPQSLRPLVLFFVLSLVVRVVLTVVLSTLSNEESYTLSFYAQLFATGLAASVILATSVLSHNFTLRFLYLPLILFIALGFLLLPVMEGDKRSVAIGIAWVGYMYIEVFVVMVAAMAASRLNISPLSLVLVFGAAIFAGSFIGRMICVALPSSTLLTDAQLNIVSTVVVMAIILVSVFLLSERRTATLWGLVNAKNNEPSAVDQIRANSQALAARRGLTPREAEVMEMLALGNDADRIQAALVLSMLTVRTHIRSIYRKIDVHSQQELIACVLKEQTE